MNAPLILSDRDRVLNMWAAFATGRQIERDTGIPYRIVEAIVKAGRYHDDVRAISHPSSAAKIWTVGMDADLSTEWTAGTVCSAIARILNQRHGTQFTKNAIIGRVHRLKLRLRRIAGISMVPRRMNGTGPRKYTRRAALAESPHRVAFPSSHRPKLRRFAPAESRTIAEPMTTIVPQVCEPVSILNIGSNQCRAIVGGQGIETMFCAAPTVAGGSWCIAHRALFYQPSTLRKAAA